jgi:hypothetical protein
MAALAPEEVDLRGDWLVQKDRSVAADATERRIEWLITQKLERIANNWSAWENPLSRPTRWSAVGPDVFTRPTCRAQDHGVSTFFHEMEPRPSIHTQPSNQALQATAPLRHPFDVALT